MFTVSLCVVLKTRTNASIRSSFPPMVRQTEAAYDAAERRLAVAMEEEEACDELVQVCSIKHKAYTS